MITAAAGFHITRYSVPPMRLRRRRPPLPAVPAIALGRRDLTLEIAEPIHPASSSPRYCVGAAGGGPAVPNQPAAQARTSSTTIMASTALPQGSGPRGHRPPLRSLRPPRLRPMIRCLAAYISDAPRGGEREGAAAHRPRATSASATARSRSEGCGRSSRAFHHAGGPSRQRRPPLSPEEEEGQRRRPTPSVCLRPDDPELGH
jgi:hypothetical protein